MSHVLRHGTPRPAAGQLGLTLVEIMVALAIGVFLIAGALTVFAKTRDLYRTNESVARLQENARYAVGAIEADMRMANYWGLNNRGDLADVPAGLRNDVAMDLCADDWAIDVPNYLSGSNGDYEAIELCAPPAGADEVSGSDVVTIRHASVETLPAPYAVDTVKLAAGRVRSAVFTGTTMPAGFAGQSEVRRMVVNSYYVQATPVPTLRRKRLAEDSVSVVDEEIMAGVEDLQVEVGVDTDDDQNADFWEPVDLELGAGEQAAAVRIWLLVRAQDLEAGYADPLLAAGATGYVFADRTWAPGSLDARFRRVLVGKTIQLRNVRR
jgi:type IV pilus assembly protein PilW